MAAVFSTLEVQVFPLLLAEDLHKRPRLVSIEFAYCHGTMYRLIEPRVQRVSEAHVPEACCNAAPDS
jgi:hypothetical protein